MKAEQKDPQNLIEKFLVVLPAREKRLVHVTASGEWCRTRAMLAAHYSRSTSYKQQARVFDRPRVRRALLAIRYAREGSKYLTNDELLEIGINVRSERQRERREMEAACRAEAKAGVARLLASIR